MKIYYLNILLSFLILALAGSAQADPQQAQKKTIEIFAGGKQYKSYASYKAQKTKKSLRRSFLLSQKKNVQQFLSELPAGAAKEAYLSLSDKDKNDLQAELEKFMPVVEVDSNDQEIVQMKEMLSEYKLTHDRPLAIHIDASKVKTFNIPSHETGSIEDKVPAVHKQERDQDKRVRRFLLK